MVFPVTLVTGFLGAGKSTLIQQLIQSGSLRDALVVVNDFGDLSIDGQILGQGDQDVIELGGGCVCCTVRDEFVTTLKAAVEAHPRMTSVWVETSGISAPSELLAVFEAVVSTYAFVDASVLFSGAGTVTVPVNVGEAIGALSPRFVAVVVAKFSSSPSAAASSLRVFSASGAVSTRLETAVLTKAVVATAVELSPAVWVTAIVPVGSVGVPVSVGKSSGAFVSI